MKLVKNWSAAWRWFSVQSMVLAGAMHVAWASIPPDLKKSIPEDWVLIGTVALLFFGIVGRLVDQGTDE